jgi:4-amino-4-deoxy-L-arabinose transferase-like glycosyltransferase
MSVAAGLRPWGVPLVLAGMVLGLAGFVWLLQARVPASSVPAERSPPIHRQPAFWMLLVIIAVGAALRLINLGYHGLSHPEIYVPGLDLPPGLTDPPARHRFIETLRWHFHSEPHPFGYYMAMWAWTSLFGATPESIRLPHALLGLASIPLIYRVGELAYNRRAGLIAALLLALQGFHVYWSRYAKMYGPGAFFGLLATWLLLELARDRQGEDVPRRPLLEAGYVLSLVAGAFTVEFAWTVLAMHMLWTALKQKCPAGEAPRLIVLQALAAVLASPILAHAAMTGRNNAADPPTLQFLEHYFSFGFAFHHGAYDPEGGPAGPTALVQLAILALSLVLLVLGLTRRPNEPAIDTPAPKGWLPPLLIASAGAFAVIVGFLFMAERRVRAVAGASVLPWLMALVPLVLTQVRPLIRRFAPWLDRLIERQPWLVGLVWMIAIPPVLGIWVISFKLMLTAPRAFAIFVPFFLILIAVAVDRLARPRWVAPALTAGLAALFAWSAALLLQAPTSPRDYRGLAQKIAAAARPDDLYFVKPRHWLYSPMLYYLPRRGLAPQDYARVVAAFPRSRVWVLSFEDRPTQEMTNALAGYRLAGREEALNATAALYVPPTPVR